MNDQVKIKLSKFWQTSDGSIIWQINPYLASNKDLYPKKAYLVISTYPQASLNIKLERPHKILPNGQFVALVRKYAPSGGIVKVFESKEKKGSYIIEFFSSGTIHSIIVDSSAPAMISFETGTPKVSMCRITSSSCYTKKQEAKTIDTSFYNELKLEDLLFPIRLGQNESNTIVVKDNNSAKNQYSKYQKETEKRLRRRKKTLEKSLARNLKNSTNESIIEDTKKKAELLKENAYLAKKGDFSLTLKSEITGLKNDIQLDLNPDISIGANIEQLFKTAKKLEKKMVTDKGQISKINNEIESLNGSIERAKNSELSQNEIAELLKKHGLREQKQKINQTKENLVSPFRTFITEEGYIYLVGKGPKENDLLTKSARSNDFWVHTSELPGSHVIIPAKTIKNKSLDARQIKQAAMLSIHFSKLRENRAGEVYVTKKQNLSKKKGLAPGLWLIKKSETVFVRYEQTEIRDLLNSMKTN